MHDDVVAVPAPAPTVTIAVAVYNGAATIEACVASLLDLRYPRDAFEVIVVDNGSTDGTRDLLAGGGDRVRVLEEPRRGAAAARNCAVRHARGRLMAFTDADCTVERDWLECLTAPLHDRSVGITGGPILGPLAGNRIERFGERIHDQRRSIEVDDPPYVASGNWGCRREVLLDVGLFDETLLRVQDVDLAWRIGRAGYRLVYAPNAIVRHRNERTLWGLMHEGFTHGFHSVRVLEKHATARPEIRRNWSRAPVRVGRDLLRLLTGGEVVAGALQLAFDAAKTSGELLAMAQRGRTIPRGESVPPVEARPR